MTQIAVLDIAILPDASGLLRASYIRFSKGWSDDSKRAYAAQHDAQGPRRYHVVEVTDAKAEAIAEGQIYGYATTPHDPATVVDVAQWQGMR
jgi:hypothetical protein